MDASAQLLYERATQLQPSHAEAASQLEALLIERGEHQELVEFLDQYALALEGGDPASAIAVYERMAELWEVSFGRPDTAAGYRRRADELRAWLEQVGGGQAAPAQASGGDAAATVAQYEQQLAQTGDPRERLSLFTEIARLRVEELGDLEGGIQVLRQALGEAAGDIQVMHQLAGYLLARAERSEGEAAAADQRRVAELYFRIAQGVEPNDALAFLESALQALPDHEEALSLLEQQAAALGREDLLAQYWVAFLAVAPPGPSTDARRVALARAYQAAGQIDDAVFCLQPAAERGHRDAHQLLQGLYAQGAGGAASRDAPPTVQQRLLGGAGGATASEDNTAVAALRKQMHEMTAARRHDDAAELARQILANDVNDAEAFTLLEAHYRKRRDHEKLRDLLLVSTSSPELPVDRRRVRLREIATLSEAKLRDVDGAVSAWQGVVALDPDDADAKRSLRQLLERARRWDDLAVLLDAEVLREVDTDKRVELLKQLLRLHKDRRKSPADAVDVLARLHTLLPDDGSLRNELGDALLAQERWPEAASILRERIDTATHDSDRRRLLAKLAAVLDEQLDDEEGAYAVCEELLDLAPDELEVLDRMERIDERTGNHERLLAGLERRVASAPRATQAQLYQRMATIAETQLGDLSRAADFLGEALDANPENQATLAQLVSMFERAGRFADLVELLRERALIEQDPKRKAEVHRRCAVILSEHLGDALGADEAYTHLLEIEEDEAALRHLRESATLRDDIEQMVDCTRRLADLVQVPEERRDLWLDLAALQHERLGDDEAAAGTLRRALEIDPKHEDAIRRLADIAEALGDRQGLAEAWRRWVEALAPGPERLDVARRLAELCEELSDDEGATIALAAWGQDAPHDAAPFRRLRVLYEAAQQWGPLVQTLDALAECEDGFDARDEARLEAARVTFANMENAQAAWRRLEPIVREGNAAAEELLREVADEASMQAPLAALYVGLAQEEEDAIAQARYWKAAAHLYETTLEQPMQALEAGLRMLAADLSDRSALDEVDRLAAGAKAWDRLRQVYDRLLRQASDDAEKLELLDRRATLLESDHPSDALDCVLRACALAPEDDALLRRAEELARRAERSEEMLIVYDRRIASSHDDAERIDLSLRAARVCDLVLRDRDRANTCLKAALTWTHGEDEPLATIAAAAKELDEANPEFDSALKALVSALLDLAEHVGEDGGPSLVLSAVELSRRELDDERGAFELLRSGSAIFPTSDEVQDALLDASTKAKRLDALDAHLARLVQDALDSDTAAALLRRRGALLEGPLHRHQDAAEVYGKLLQLRPDDVEAAQSLRDNLRRSGRHQELLVAIEKQLRRADAEARVELLKEAAATWERHLRNRWEALDAWKRVLDAAPDDADAVAALERIEAGQLEAPPEPEPGLEPEPEASAVDASSDAVESSGKEGTLEDEQVAAKPDGPAEGLADAAQGTEVPEDVSDAAGESAPVQEAAPEAASASEAVAVTEAASDIASSSEDVAEPHATPGSEAPTDDLAALESSLDADLPDEGEIFDAADDDVEVVELDTDAQMQAASPIPSLPRASAAPPLPPRPSTPGSVPPLPGARGSQPSIPPPLPGARGSQPSVPPPLPSNPPDRSSAPPPVPSKSPARQSNPPPIPPQSRPPSRR